LWPFCFSGAGITVILRKFGEKPVTNGAFVLKEFRCGSPVIGLIRAMLDHASKQIAEDEMETPGKIDDLPDIKVLTEAELSKLLGVGVASLHRMRREGKAPPQTQLTPGGRDGKGARYGYTVAAVREWLKARTVTGDAA
jgi:predicted DNA-binding transcriptional regulator AlpA